MERRWIILIISGAVIMATLIVGLLIHASFHRDSCSEDVCQTPECVQAAAHILNYIDVKVKPCDNFYNFVCGNFIRTSEIPDDMDEVSTNSIIKDELQKQLRISLEEPLELSEIKPFQIMKTYYQACSNTEAIERHGIQIVRDLLKDVGGWPVLEDDKWEDKNLDWYSYVYKFRQLGLNTNQFMELAVQHDLKNSTVHILQLDQPSFSLPRDFLIDNVQNKYIDKYRRYMVNVAVYLGAPEYQAIIDLRQSLQFEMKLANISLSEENRLNITNFYNIMTIKELLKQYSTIPWLEYINNLITPHYQISTHERILVLVPDYIKGLEDLLQKTSRRDLVNYLIWKAIASIIPYLSEDLREMEFKFQSVTSGVEQRLPRWKECLQKTYKSFPIALSALYVRNFFKDDIKRGVEEIVQFIKQDYLSSLEKLDWMDKKTKKSALEKVEAISEVIGYPEELLDDNKLAEIYSEVEVNPKEYLKSFLNVSIMMLNLQYKQLRMLKAETDWLDHSTIAEVDAFYSALTNTITIPAGILQRSYFNQQRPNYLNYGAIGFAIGHEITHAFDDTGRLFDKNGSLVNWWEEETETSYLDKVQCIIDQYSDYTVSEVNETLNGMITLGENIADNGGVKHAYGGYLKWVERNGKEKTLPGLPYNTKQLFWISFALHQCSKQRVELLKLVTTANSHSPAEFRVTGPLSNSDEFVHDFNCLSDSQMNCKSKCIVW